MNCTVDWSLYFFTYLGYKLLHDHHNVLVKLQMMRIHLLRLLEHTDMMDSRNI